MDIQKYSAVLDKSTLKKEKKDILNLSLTTNTSIHTVSEIIEDPKEEYLNNLLQEQTDDSASSSKKVMKKILEKLALNNISKQNDNNDDVDISINVTDENQNSPEKSPRSTHNEDSTQGDKTQEDETLNNSPAKRIKLDKSETETPSNDSDSVNQSKSSDEVLYNIEKIVKSRKNPKNKKELQYFIKWEGWSSKTNTWEPADYIRQTVPALVEVFEQNQKNKRGAGKNNKTRAQQKKQVQNKKSYLFQMSIERISCGHFQNK